LAILVNVVGYTGYNFTREQPGRSSGATYYRLYSWPTAWFLWPFVQ